MQDPITRLHRTKTTLACLLLVVAGVLVMVLDQRSSAWAGWGWLQPVPLNELGGILVGAGLVSVWLDGFLRREQEAVDDQRLRALLQEQAPAMRDAVLHAFAANHEDLERVATPEMLDQVITNSLALRLNDQQFADEVYRDIRDQAVMAEERWLDANLSIDLSPADDPDYFAVLVRWEYTVVPKHSVRRFVCLSDREEYLELAHERSNTSAWYMKPSGVDGSSRKSFELLRFTVDGEERTIRRSQRKGSQTYTASVGSEALDAGKPVSVAYTYRTVTRRDGNMLFFDIEQPTRDLSIDFNYSGCGFTRVSGTVRSPV